MYRDKKTRKQTLSLKNFARFASNSPRPLAIQKQRFKLRPSSLFVGITATIGITSIALAATQQNLHVKSNQINKASTPSSTSFDNKTSTDITIENSSSSGGAVQQDNVQTQDSSQMNSQDTQVTINNESIPLNNGTVQRTFTDSNGSTYSVTINVDADSDLRSSSRNSMDIDIDTSSTTTDNMTRGSPN